MGRASAVHYAAALAFVAASVAPASAAEFANGNQLLAACSSENASEGLQCIAFLDGVLMGALVISEREKTSPPFCIPPTATNGQLKDVVTAFLRDRPAVRHYGGGALTVVALIDAFPCASK